MIDTPATVSKTVDTSARKRDGPHGVPALSMPATLAVGTPVKRKSKGKKVLPRLRKVTMSPGHGTDVVPGVTTPAPSAPAEPVKGNGKGKAAVPTPATVRVVPAAPPAQPLDSGRSRREPKPSRRAAGLDEYV